MRKNKLFALLLSAVCVLGVQKASAEGESSSTSSSGYAKKFQFDLLIGRDVNRQDKFSDDWEHQTSDSPIGQFQFHWNFFAQKPVNLIVGGEVGLFKSVETISGSSTATATTTGWGIGPLIGVGFNPGGPNGRWKIQLNGSFTMATKSTKLKTGGFTATMRSVHTSLEIGGSATGQFCITENWRILAGAFGADTEAIGFGAGVGYAF